MKVPIFLFSFRFGPTFRVYIHNRLELYISGAYLQCVQSPKPATQMLGTEMVDGGLRQIVTCLLESYVNFVGRLDRHRDAGVAGDSTHSLMSASRLGRCSIRCFLLMRPSHFRQIVLFIRILRQFFYSSMLLSIIHWILDFALSLFWRPALVCTKTFYLLFWFWRNKPFKKVRYALLVLEEFLKTFYKPGFARSVQMFVW